MRSIEFPIEKVKALFLLSDIVTKEFHRLHNPYWGDSPEYSEYQRFSPWWLVQTDFGNIKIGWRKRVIDINWADCGIRGIITRDDVTKNDVSVHAWGYGKAVEYLTELNRRLEHGQRSEVGSDSQ